LRLPIAHSYASETSRPELIVFWSELRLQP